MASPARHTTIHNLTGDNDTGYINTFHGFCVSVLQEDSNAVQYPKSFLVLDNSDIDSMLKIIYEERSLTLRDMTFSKARDMIEMQKLLHRPSYYLDMIKMSPEDLHEKYMAATEPKDIIFYGYLYQEKKCFGLDYNDLIKFSLYIFEEHPDIRLKWQKRLEYIIIDEFQDIAMVGVVQSVLVKTAEGFTCNGTENLTALQGRKFLAVSNHRDIVLDPALIQYSLHEAGLPYSELCVGSNLLKNQLIEDLMRSNRMIKVIRGISARELYLSSRKLSGYIRGTIVSGAASVWIAQREGRTKDGADTTEQGLLKMFDLSGENGFEQNFKDLCIVPMSISYEYEPCDARKAREILIRRQTGTYRKKPNEDTHSILTGIRQVKGHIMLNIGRPLTDEELARAAACSGNDRYQSIRHLLDERIISGYKLFKTNYMGYDLMNGTSEYLGVKYLPEDLESFRKYTEHKIGKLERRLDRDALRDIFWHIYGNPVAAKAKLNGKGEAGADCGIELA